MSRNKIKLLARTFAEELLDEGFLRCGQHLLDSGDLYMKDKEDVNCVLAEVTRIIVKAINKVKREEE